MSVALAVGCGGNGGLGGSGGHGGAQGSAGRGGSTASAGTGGAGAAGTTGSAGGTSGSAGTAGTAPVGGTTGSAGIGGAAGAGATSADPWPASCVTVALDRRPSAADLTGPNSNSGSGPTMPGEFVAAKLNGLARTFSASLTIEVWEDAGAMRWFSARVYGPDGAMDVVVPDAGPGSYLCPNAVVGYSNVKGTTTIGNAYLSSCCRIDVTKAGGLPGETVEGTFSGILISGGNQTWLKAEEGSFKVVRRDPR